MAGIEVKKGMGLHTLEGARQFGRQSEAQALLRQEAQNFVLGWMSRHPLRSGDPAIDLCCGQGEISAALATRLDVHALDSSARQIAAAWSRYPGQEIRFGVADAADPMTWPQWPQIKYRAACCVNGLPYMTQEGIEGMLHGLKTVLVPSAPVLIITPNPPAYPVYIAEMPDPDVHVIVPPSFYPGVSHEPTNLYIGERNVTDLQAGKVITLSDDRFHAHPEGNIKGAIGEAGLRIQKATEFAPAHLAGKQEDVNLYLALELLA